MEQTKYTGSVLTIQLIFKRQFRIIFHFVTLFFMPKFDKYLNLGFLTWWTERHHFMTRLFQQLNSFANCPLAAEGGIHATVIGVPWKKDTECASNCDLLTLAYFVGFGLKPNFGNDPCFKLVKIIQKINFGYKCHNLWQTRYL